METTATPIDDYLTHRSANQTLVEASVMKANRVLRSLEASAGDLRTASRDDIEAWLNSQELAPVSRRSYLSTVATFYRWAGARGIIDKDPTFGIETPRVHRGENRSLGPAELEALEWVLPDNRARLIYSLMRYEGLRAGEVAAALVEDVDLERRAISPRGKGYRGQRSRRVPLTDNTVKYLRLYAPERRTPGGNLIRSTRYPTEGLSSRRITKMMSAWMEEAGIKRGAYDGVSAHALRHTAAEEVAEHADDIRLVQQFLGHSNLATTQTYLRREVEGLGEIQKLRRR